MANSGGIWTGLLKWSLAQPGFGSNPNDVHPMSDADKQYLKAVFDNLIVDEVKRMKIIVEILRMPDDEPGLKRLLGESAAALEKLNEVALPRSEAEHYGASKPATSSSTTTTGANLAAPSPAHPATLQTPSKPSSRPSSRSASPLPSPSPSPNSAAIAAAAAAGPVPTVHDYKHASVAEVRQEMIRRKEGALEELDDRVVTSDNANDFMKIKGLEPLLICMLSDVDGIRWRAAQALSTIVQNNPNAQKFAFEAQAIEYLVPLLTPPQPPKHTTTTASSSTSSTSSAMSAEALEDAMTEKWTVVVKALTALSALIRSDDLPMIRDAFMKADGFNRLATLLTFPTATTRVQTKVFQLLKLILTWFPATKELVVNHGLLPHIIKFIGRSNDINHREGCIRLLNEFARPTGNSKEHAIAKELRHSKYGLKDILHHRVKAIKAHVTAHKDDKDMMEDELQQTNALIKTCKF